jgi:hypothetical protein
VWWQLAITGVMLFGSVLLWHLNQRAATNDRKRQEYAKALALVFKWQEMPYRILRRDPESPAQPLIQRMHDLQEKIAFYEAWIAVESTQISVAYRDLIKETRKQVAPHLQAAWQSDPPISPNVGNRYPVEVEQYKRSYIEAVRAHFQWTNWSRR